MSDITRRDLLVSGLAVSASSLLTPSALARSAASLAGEVHADLSAASSAVEPREQLLFDFGWKFTFGHGTDPAKDLGFGVGQSDFAAEATVGQS